MPPNPDLMLVADALDLAARQHRDQRRKGARSEPYINHLVEVTNLLVQATKGIDPVLAAAGALHDVVEDTEITERQLEARFGAEVVSVVLEVTDDMSLPKPRRKRIQIETIPHKSDRARLLKLADKTSNLRDIIASPPAKWTPERIARYVEWAAQVVDAGCRGLNAELEAEFDRALAQGRALYERSAGAAE